MGTALLEVLVIEGPGPAPACRRSLRAPVVPPEALAALSGVSPGVVVIEPTLERPTAAARSALRRWPRAKIVFLAAPDALRRLQASLPFLPDLAGAVALSSEVSEGEFLRVVEQLAVAAERERTMGGLYQRLNSQIETLGMNRTVLQDRQRQLVLAERYLATVLDHAPQALVACEPGGGLVTWNSVAGELLELAADDGGSNLADHFAAESRADVHAILAEAALGRTGRGEATVERPGRRLFLDISAAPVLGADGTIAGISFAALDITERKRIEAALADTNRRLNAVLNNATVSIFVMDEHQHCAYMNEAAERLTGFRWEETRGRPLHDVIHHTHPDGSHYPLEDCPIDRAFPEDNQQQGEDVFVHKDGRFYPVAFTASPIRDDASRTIGTIIEVRDISEERRDREARELLMREVDHRARNVLTIVQSMVQLTKAADIPAYRDVLIGRIGALARAQSSLASSAWRGARLREVVEDELHILGRPGAYEVEGPEVLLQPEQVQPISMIVHELATNAAKYGAFSTEAGGLRVTWTVEAQALRLTWTEGGASELQEPTRRGFGSRLIGDLARQLNGELALDWAPTGLAVQLTLPLVDMRAVAPPVVQSPPEVGGPPLG